MSAAALRGLARRRPVRLRLTILYAVLFLLAGAALLSVTYTLVVQKQPTQPPVTNSRILDYENAAYKGCAATLKMVDPQRCKEQAANYAIDLANASAAGERSRTLNRLLYVSIGALAFMAMISGGLGWLIAGRALRPVHAITAAARRASEEDLGVRIAQAGPDDELKDLADTFDAMLARLEGSFASQRRFVANASHELRTPLTVMRTAIDVTLAKKDRTPAQLETMAGEVRQAADRADALIEALLTLARSDRGNLPREPLDIAVLAEDALDGAATAIKARPLTICASLRPAPALGDPVLVERLVTNLIDNAIRYNVADGSIQATTGTRDGVAYLEVANTGEPVPEDAVPSLFEPFRRLSGRAGTPDGSGLGLSIVKAVAIAHKGQVSARCRPEGGLEISVLLPRGLGS
jgi:signal transduction histidine kinase